MREYRDRRESRAIPQMTLTLGHLYPDQLNLYGDRGNILTLQQRCRWRGIELRVVELGIGDALDPDALQHLRPVLVGVTQEHGVHDVAFHVVRVGLGRALQRELEQPDLDELPQRRAGRVPSGPRLVDEPRVVQLVQEPDLLEDQIGRWREGLPNVVARVDVLLDDQRPITIAGEHCPERCPGRPATDDDDVGVKGSTGHAVSPFLWLRARTPGGAQKNHRERTQPT